MPDEQPIDDDSNNANNDKMRRYPSSLCPHKEGGTLDNLKSKVLSPGQIFILEGRGVLQTNANPMHQVLTKFLFLGEVVLWTPHPSNTWVEALKEFCTRNSGNWNVVVHRR